MYILKIMDVFLYSIECALKYDKIKRHQYTSSHQNNGADEKEKLFIEHNIEIPVKVNDRVYKKIEKLLDISINVYTFSISHKSETILYYNRYPVHISNNIKQNHINLLYFSDDNETYHYVWIKHFNRFMSDITLHNGKKYFCCKCFYFVHQKKNLMNIMMIS